MYKSAQVVFSPSIFIALTKSLSDINKCKPFLGSNPFSYYVISSCLKAALETWSLLLEAFFGVKDMKADWLHAQLFEILLKIGM